MEMNIRLTIKTLLNYFVYKENKNLKTILIMLNVGKTSKQHNSNSINLVFLMPLSVSA